MYRSLLACCAAMLLVAGCENMKNPWKNDSGTHGAMGMKDVDVCPHCPGKQTVTADGKCSGCGMAVTDVCPNCPGVQVRMSDGTCSGCGKKL